MVWLYSLHAGKIEQKIIYLILEGWGTTAKKGDVAVREKVTERIW